MKPVLTHTAAALSALVLGMALQGRSDVGSVPGAPSSARAPARQRTDSAEITGTASAVSLSAPLAAAENALRRAARMNVRELIAALQQSVNAPASAAALLERQIFLTQLSEREPETALSWASSLGPDERGAAAVTAYSVWAARAPVEAAEHFSENSEDLGSLSGARRQSAAGLAAQWAMSDAPSSLKWAAGLSPDLSGGALASVVRALNSTDPVRAADEINALPEGFERTELIQSVTRDQARTAPERTAAWVTTIDPHGPELPAAVTALVRTWSARNPRAAAAWAAAQPAGTVRETALAALPVSLR